jgi:hypothetical protein
MDKKELELIFGVICFAIAIILGIREYKVLNATQNDDWIRKSFSIKKIGGIIGLCLVGLVVLYRYFF